MWGRLRPDQTAKSARGELEALAVQLRQRYPNDIWEHETLPTEPGAYIQSAGGRERGNAPSTSRRTQMYTMFALIAALTLLILAVTCGNLGSLLLARGVSRDREISIRTSIGAATGRIIRQLLTESLVLALIGSTAAIVIGYVVLDQMMAWTGAPTWLDMRPDLRVVAFTFALGITASMLFGLAPAVHIARSRHRSTIARQLLIGGQVAASCVLLIVAGLLVRGLHHAASSNPGFEYKQVIAVDPRLTMHGFTPVMARGYLNALTERVQALPGVESVSLAVTPPLGNRSTTAGTEKDGKSFSIHLNLIDPEYFSTMKIPLLRGRNFRQGETNSVIVSESLAKRLWPGEEPLGKNLTLGSTQHPVIAVAGNARVTALADSDAVEMYRLFNESDTPSLVLLARTAGSVDDAAQASLSLAKALDANAKPSVQTLRGAFERKLEGVEQSAMAVSVLGSVALLLACLGIVGSVSYSVAQRTKEIGIRMALGAMPSNVLWGVVRKFWPPIVAGLLIGVAAAAALSQVLRRELYGLSNLDPIAYFAAVALFVMTASVAAVFPARRALRIDPLRALRWE